MYMYMCIVSAFYTDFFCFPSCSTIIFFFSLCATNVTLQNDSELCGRVLRTNVARPVRIREGWGRPGKIFEIYSWLLF